jgi:hypothetical protein
VLRDLHPDWYRQSEGVLGMRARRQGISHNVTPAILHRRAVAALAEYLDEVGRQRRFAPGVRGLKQRLAFLSGSFRVGDEPWRLLLASSAPWTEYAIYYTYLEATGRFEQFHEHVATGLYDPEASLWRADRRDFDAWTPSAALQGAGAPWFVVVQSNTGICPAAVEAKLVQEFSHA